MDKKVIVSMGLPVVIRNAAGKMATIELNNHMCVVCRFHPNDSTYLGDANLVNWYPENLFKKMIYDFKVRLSKW